MTTVNTLPVGTPRTDALSKARRDQSIDAIRGLAIIGVVYIHAAWLTGAPVIPTSSFRWGVPAFIMVASILAARPDRRQYVHELKARVSRLMLPYAFWTAVYLCLASSVREQPLLRTVALNLLGYGWSGQYFFVVLLQLTPLLPLLAAVRWRLLAVITTIIASATIAFLFREYVPRGTTFSPLGDRPFVYWLGFCVSGMWIAQNRGRLEVGRRLPRWTCLAGLLAAVAAITVEIAWLDEHRPGRANAYLATTVQVLSPVIFLLLWFLLRQPSRITAMLALANGLWESSVSTHWSSWCWRRC